ncbi:disease resistance protein RPP2B isoform X1 [Physcomitrium patens]
MPDFSACIWLTITLLYRHPADMGSKGFFFRHRDWMECWGLNIVICKDTQRPSRAGIPLVRIAHSFCSPSIKLGLSKHDIFLSHSRGQKDFVEQLCVDLEAQGYSPFFDGRLNSLPKGKEFAPLILKAAQHCHVAVIVLSQDYLISKWPMIELSECHAAEQAGNQALNLLPLFFKSSVHDLDDQAIKERWMSTWKEYESEDKRIDVAKWCEAVRALRKVNGIVNGIVFGKHSTTEVAYRKEIVQSICILLPPDLVDHASSKNVVVYDRTYPPGVEILREDPLASKLKSLSMKTRRDKKCKVKVEIAELTGSRCGPCTCHWTWHSNQTWMVEAILS